MKTYHRKPERVRAQQWFKLGDHPDVVSAAQYITSKAPCRLCGHPMPEHGFQVRDNTLDLVCPSNYIFEDIVHLPMSAAEFEARYVLANKENQRA